ncbi:MAG: FAD-binding protein [Spirochaetales bacterium]|nr:FAD-binding protein [Spirochaetales bacterium]
MKLNKGTVKPVIWGIEEEKLDDIDSFGVKRFSDFTWKHMLDFYTCADCGRCADHCPATAVGRPLSPRFISIKCRDYIFKKYSLLGKTAENSKNLIGDIFTEDEIWSCTTCGACEAECPLMVEYIDKIVDLRRGMVDDGIVPQSLQKPLRALEKRGNPYGKIENKRSDWTKEKGFSEKCKVKIIGKKEMADALYFVDSITSFDDRMHEIARSAAGVLHAAGVDFGIWGSAEKDSGNEVRRFGEEMLFQKLKEQKTEAILSSGAKKIVTADPHAFNSLKNDYKNIPQVEHISQVIARKIKAGAIRLNGVKDSAAVYTYHDPCYLGRHNGIYSEPRDVIDAIPGIRRVEMHKSRDRSFCCGGGGLMLFYEPVEEKRMGCLRVEMAKEAGATVIVTACPFCMANIEDAIKTSGLEGKMEVIEAEVGDVNITKSEILVSVGRWVEDKDNLEIVYDLAKAMGGDVACSRPVVDAKWLEKSRQVGTSGKTVKPKVYMALGISGSFQHQGGIKGAPFIVAINKNPKAPIFKVADVSVVADMLDFVPKLTDKINSSRSQLET